MTNPGPSRRFSDPRAGIALILVLGFLSLLIIMAVGFAISMRVERLVARTSLDHIRGLQLGEAALARVVRDINADVGDDLVPDWTENWVGGAFESVGTGTKADNLLVGYATNYVPLWLWTSATSAAANAEWVPFEYIENGQTRRVGQYAYVVLDCSGMLDVNYDYSKTNNLPRPRFLGESLYELQLTNELMREVRYTPSDPRVWTNLFFSRLATNGMAVAKKAWIRLETLPEFNPMLTHGSDFNGQYPMGNNTTVGTNSVNFITYSRIPRGYYEAPGSVKLPTFIGSPLDSASINNTFADLGMPDPAGLVNNLKDYTDSDNVPTPNPDSFGVESVPMINEIVVSNSYVDVLGDGTSFRNEYRLLTEVWYPFTGVNSNAYSLRIIGQYQGANPAPNLPLISEIVPMTAPGGSWSLGDFLVVTSSAKILVTNFFQNLSGVKVRASSRVLENGVEVDRVGGSGTTLLELDIGSKITGYGNFFFAKATDDPRLNWNGADAGQWKTVATHTLGTTNSGLTYASAGSDGHPLMYVANRSLRTVGELGLLLFSATKPWQTISLLNGANFYPVLDRFSLSTNDIQYGLINPNGKNSNVLATVFNRMPVERVPYDPAGIKLTIPQLRSLGAKFAENSILFTNLSDLRFIRPLVTNAMVNVPSNMAESVVINSAGLLSPRQQLYVVFLVAQAQDDTDDHNVLSEQRGTGLIWRDPYIVSNNTHATMVRNFRWLTE
jgi:hypothetical protein